MTTKAKADTLRQLKQVIEELRAQLAQYQANSPTPLVPPHKDLRQSEEEFRALAQHSPDVIVRLDHNGRMVYVNSTAAQLTGLVEEDFVGKTFEEMRVPRRLIPLWSERVRWVVEHGQPTTMEFEYPTVLGPRAFETQLVPEFDAAGRVGYVLTVSRDITERQRANAELEQRVRERTAELDAERARLQQLNQALEQRAAELEMANRELESFSYSASHDLRTPLGAIIHLTDAVLEDHAAQLPARAHSMIQLIQANGEAMERLLTSLLELSRSARQPLNKAPIAMNALVRQVWEDLRPQWEGRTVEFAVGMLPDSHADPVLLRQVWSNLLSNALKFTRRREVARIEIGVETPPPAPPLSGEGRGERSVVYFVKDNGVGFDMGNADKLFGVFRRLHTEDEYEGSGVGLAIVERIIRRHGGSVCADAHIDQGATFFFTLGGN